MEIEVIRKEGITALNTAVTEYQNVIDSIKSTELELMATVGINPTYISETTANPPNAPENTKGLKRNADGSIQKITFTGGSWVPYGNALASVVNVIEEAGRTLTKSVYANAVGEIKAGLLSGKFDDSLMSAKRALLKGSIKVLVIGDSISEGADVTNNADPYQRALESAIESMESGAVINYQNMCLGGRGMRHFLDDNYKGVEPEPAMEAGFGHRGQGDSYRDWVQVGKSWKQHALDFNPDLVIIAFGMNEADAPEYDAYTRLEAVYSLFPNASKMFVTTFTGADAPEFRPRILTLRMSNLVREFAKNKGCFVADAGRLFQILNSGIDVVATLPEVSAKVSALSNQTDWGYAVTGSDSTYSINAGADRAEAFNTMFYTKSKFKDFDLEFILAFDSETPYFFIRYRNEAGYGNNVVQISPQGLGIADSAGAGRIKVFHSSEYNFTTQMRTSEAECSIPLNTEIRLRMSVKGTSVKFFLNGNNVPVLSAQVNECLQDGMLSFGTEGTGKMPSIRMFKLVKYMPIKGFPLYSNSVLIGSGPIDDSNRYDGNSVNHPTKEGYELFYTPALPLVEWVSTVIRNTPTIAGRMIAAAFVKPPNGWSQTGVNGKQVWFAGIRIFNPKANIRLVKEDGTFKVLKLARVSMTVDPNLPSILRDDEFLLMKLADDTMAIFFTDSSTTGISTDYTIYVPQ